MSRPSTCGISTEDLECLGCGMKLGGRKPWQCGHEDAEKRRAAQAEAKERAELARLKAKYEGKT